MSSRAWYPETLTWDEATPLVVRGVTSNDSALQAHLTRTTQRPTEGLCARVLEAGRIEEADIRILRAANVKFWFNRGREFVGREEKHGSDDVH
jgi:hypothetical protein